jgi:arylformamidase
MRLTVEFGGRTWRADVARSVDISMPLNFAGEQPSFFGAPPATATPLRAGSFTGEVRTGASCNCATYSLTPHCNGTHTESFGHLTSELSSVHELARELLPARVLTVAAVNADANSHEHDVVTTATDRLITAEALQGAAGVGIDAGIRALIVRSLREPHGEPPYFTTAAMRWIVAQGIEHLVVDVPSLDRGDDGGRLLCHRIFWAMSARETGDERCGRPDATVTEFAFIPPRVNDGLYLLNLQIAPFIADAAPSRPLLYPLEAM